MAAVFQVAEPAHLPIPGAELDRTDRDGFFATVAAGGVCRSMAGQQKPSRRKAIAENREGLQRAEHAVHQHWDAWLEGRPTPCAAALDEALEAWRAVEPGGTLTLEFPDLPVHPARPGTRRRRDQGRR